MLFKNDFSLDFSSIKDLTRDSRELRFSGSFKIFIMVEVVYPIMHAQEI